MNQPPFRSEANDNLVSTEELSQASKRIETQSAFLLVAVFALLIAGLLFAVYVKIPVKIDGTGVLWSPEGVRQVTASAPGRVLKIPVGPGDRVEVGAIFAYLDQSDLTERLASSRTQLAALRAHVEGLEQLQENARMMRAQLGKERDELMAESRARSQEQAARLSKRLAEIQPLLDDGLVDPERTGSLLTQLTQTDEQQATLSQQVLSEQRQEHEMEMASARELLRLRLESAQLASETALLERQLANDGVQTSPVAGRVVELTAAVGDYLSPGAPIAIIQPEETEGALEAILFLPSQQAKPLAPGMAAELSLAAYPKDLHGKLLGRVHDISPLPLSTAALMRELRNDQLVRSISEAGSPFLVRLELERDPTTGSFTWSSPPKGDRQLAPGMSMTGSIITGERPLYQLFLPKSE